MKKFISILTLLASLCLLLFTLSLGTGCEDPTPDPICEAPTDVQVIAITDSSATLTWTAPQNTTVEISIEPTTPAGPFTTTANTLTINGCLQAQITLRVYAPYVLMVQQAIQ